MVSLDGWRKQATRLNAADVSPTVLHAPGAIASLRIVVDLLTAA